MAAYLVLEVFTMSEKSELKEKLQMKKKNIFEGIDEGKKKKIFDFSESYKAFLDEAKTEREATEFAVRLAREKGFTEYRIGERLKVGDKKYYNNRGKSLFVFKIGSRPLDNDGIRILAAHIDSPRIDLKQVPLYEDGGMAFFKTHYYGGIRKYQWTATPLSLHGVVVKKDGSEVKIRIGDSEGDPVFYINDLLPHLAAEQNQKPLGTAISGESLNILVGGIPLKDGDADGSVKLNILNILNEKYGITEEDLISAELSCVPAFNARDIGFDRALIGAYGHDDRVCAYPLLRAVTESDGDSTVLGVLADKEETGSLGNTGMQSMLLLDLINEISASLGYSGTAVRAVSKCLSADVNAAFDPNFADVYEKRNSAMISCGTTMSKYTGARGKSGTSDASAEFVGYVRRVFDENGVIWQTSELGKVDIGGGGTVAMYIANLNIDTVDLGVPVISMHAPYEVISKADLYSTYEAFSAFIK